MAAIAIPHPPPAAPRRRLSSWQTWGVIMLMPYILVFLVFVLYPVTYGLWLARHPQSYRTLFEDPVFFRTVVNTIVFLLVAVNLKFLLALSMAMLVHIWKALPFWTLILMAGRLAIPREQYEAASVDGATAWQKFKYVTWPSIRTLYLTSTLLSMIWTLGDFNSVYLLTGGGPADLTHVLATLGIRYIRLDQVDQAMTTIVVALPFVLPLVYFMMKRLSVDE